MATSILFRHDDEGMLWSLFLLSWKKKWWSVCLLVNSNKLVGGSCVSFLSFRQSSSRNIGILRNSKRGGAVDAMLVEVFYFECAQGVFSGGRVVHW